MAMFQASNNGDSSSGFRTSRSRVYWMHLNAQRPEYEFARVQQLNHGNAN